jgi:hypothetical protein
MMFFKYSTFYWIFESFKIPFRYLSSWAVSKFARLICVPCHYLATSSIKFWSDSWMYKIIGFNYKLTFYKSASI